MSAPVLYLGLDVGTQGTKGLAVDESGRVLARANRSYELIGGLPPGCAEQHPRTWLDAIEQVCRELWTQVDRARVAALSVSGQQHGCVLVDERGEPLRSAKLWCDTSTVREAERLSARLGRPLPVGFTASKIAYSAEREPELWKRARWVLLPHDFVNLRLTGRTTMEAGDASGTGLFDVRARRFDDRAVEAVGPALAARLPPLIGAGEPAGTLDARGAALTGLPEGTLVGSGSGDNMCSAIGAGALAPGDAVLSLGTSGTLFAYAAAPPAGDLEGIAPFCDATGGWLPLLCVMNCTGVLEELGRCFGRSLDELTSEAERVPPGCDGVLFVPFLAGERVPDLPFASGTLVGLRNGHLRPGLMFRAALEGIALNLAGGLARLRERSIPIASARLVGGGARNQLWRQILADALDLPLLPLAERETAALGAALLARWTHRRQTADPGIEAAGALGPYAARPVGRVDPLPAGVERYAGMAGPFQALVRGTARGRSD
jgi:xylulokinase